jgi:hypothetical protein
VSCRAFVNIVKILTGSHKRIGMAKYWLMGPAEPETKNECAGRDQKQFTR